MLDETIFRGVLAVIAMAFAVAAALCVWNQVRR